MTLLVYLKIIKKKHCAYDSILWIGELPITVIMEKLQVNYLEIRENLDLLLFNAKFHTYTYPRCLI